jgi:GT2 family glycosyltransferase
LIRHLTVAVCSRNRPDDLKRCLASVATAVKHSKEVDVDILIIDDGVSDPSGLASIKEIVHSCGCLCAYFNKSECPGLIYSRLAAIERAHGDAILFLDDDAEVEQNYLEQLAHCFQRYPSVVGVGGIDLFLPPKHPLWRVASRVFFWDSGRSGKLAWSGLNGSIWRWQGETAAFETEYLSGCNMCFRSSSIRHAEAVEWLRGYSNGEDVYLSCMARRSAPSARLLVDPQLRVRHHRSPLSRPDAAECIYRGLINTYHILRLSNVSRLRYCALVWSGLGLSLSGLLSSQKRQLGQAKAAWRAVKDILSHRAESPGCLVG